MPAPIVYLGSGAFGLPTLQHLASTRAIAAIVTQPDKPAGRGMKLTPTPIAQWASEHLPGVPIFKPANVNEPAIRDEIRAASRAAGASAWVVIAFGQKLSPELLADVFAINLHASLLPRYRGAAPINAAMLGGDEVTGNSVITLADRMDAGLILGQSRRTIDPLVTFGQLHDLLAADGPALVASVLDQHAAGTLQPQRQDEALVTKARKLSKADGVLDFTRPARALRCQVHALTPWPGVSVTLGTHRVKLLQVREHAATGTHAPTAANATTLISTSPALIACGDNSALEPLIVQPESGKAMAYADFARSRTLPVGTVVTAM